MQRKKPQWRLGVLSWYDSKTGHGCIIGDDGTFYRVRRSSKQNVSLSKFKTQSRIKFLLAEDSVHAVVTQIESASTTAHADSSPQQSFEKARGL